MCEAILPGVNEFVVFAEVEVRNPEAYTMGEPHITIHIT